jgi:hypothetical protein
MSEFGGDGSAVLHMARVRRSHEDALSRIAANQQAHYLARLFPQAGALNLLAEGDSWFDYPIHAPPPQTQSDILAQIPLRAAPGLAPTILKLADLGDVTSQMLGVAQRRRMREMLTSAQHGPFDAILFSGGGNDLCGDQFRLWLNDAGEVGNVVSRAINRAALGHALALVRIAYEDLIRLRDAVAPGVPIFVHGYDKGRPTGVGVCGVGPWLRPSLEDRGWVRSDAEIGRGAAIVEDMLALFDALLDELAVPANNVVKVPTLGALTAPGQWDNELHPTYNGFTVIADRFVAALRGRFPGRI